MKKTPTIFRIPFDELHGLFKSEPCCRPDSNAGAGDGAVRTFRLEKGLRATMWNCSFTKGLEMFCNAGAGAGNIYFTIAFFLDLGGLQFSNSYIPFRENSIWDTLLISSNSCLRMYVPPMAKMHALTVSFSKKWLDHNVMGSNDAFKCLRHKIDTSEKLTLPEYMHASERKMITELIDESMRKPLGSFYITSVVLKVISDFFDKVKKKEDTNIQNNSLDGLLAETEKLLCNPATAKMPSLKYLACKYGFSESALKRQFRQRFGASLPSYFIKRRMEYAMQLICKQKLNLTDAARLLGYKNVNHFIAIFKKHFNAIPDPQLQMRG